MRRAVAIAGILVLLLAACGKDTIKADGAEDTIVRVVSSQTAFKPDDVKCPSGVEAKEGGTFECHFTGPEGPYTAFMRIREVDGERVLFGVRTRPDR